MVTSRDLRAASPVLVGPEGVDETGHRTPSTAQCDDRLEQRERLLRRLAGELQARAPSTTTSNFPSVRTLTGQGQRSERTSGATTRYCSISLVT